MARKKTIIGLVIFLGILLAGGGVFYFLKFRNKSAEIASSAILAEEARKNYFEINDETIGVNFKISKQFKRMSSTDLQAMNAGFLYGFSANDDSKVKCYISQTKRPQEGQVALSFLRDGVFEQIKKNKQDANLDDAQIIEIGDNNKGVKVKMSYSDANQNNMPVIQWEIAGITNKSATFAFCVSPKAVIDLYKEDIDLFLDSVRIK